MADMDDMEERKFLDELMKESVAYAKAQKHEYITTEHLVMALFTMTPRAEMLDYFANETMFDIDQFVTSLQGYLSTEFDGTLADGVHPKDTSGVQRVFRVATAAARISKRSIPDAGDLLLAASSEDNTPAEALLNMHSNTGEIKEKMMLFRDGINNVDLETPEGLEKAIEQANKTLAEYSTNLNEEVADDKIDPLIGRHKEIRELTKVLALRKKNNAILVGEAGVGKTAIAEGLAYRIVMSQVAKEKKNQSRIH